jgi:hypothetical protein
MWTEELPKTTEGRSNAQEVSDGEWIEGVAEGFSSNSLDIFNLIVFRKPTISSLFVMQTNRWEFCRN